MLPIEIQAATFARFLKAARLHASDDVTRPAQCCVRFAVEGGALVVEATDGHTALRIMHLRTPITGGAYSGVRRELLLPLRSPVLGLKKKDDPALHAWKEIEQHLRSSALTDPIAYVVLGMNDPAGTVSLILRDGAGFNVGTYDFPRIDPEQFPRVAQVMPKRRAFTAYEDFQSSAFRVNPRYLARCAESCAACFEIPESVQMYAADPWSPLVIEATDTYAIDTTHTEVRTAVMGAHGVGEPFGREAKRIAQAARKAYVAEGKPASLLHPWIPYGH